MNELQNIQDLIYIIRGQRVMLDFDLAMLYEVETRSLNQTVKRNARRFPNDFMFQLTEQEWSLISSQFVMTSRMKRPKKSLPCHRGTDPLCHGTGICQNCLGRGAVINHYTGEWSYCTYCNNADGTSIYTGKCYACKGQ